MLFKYICYDFRLQNHHKQLCIFQIKTHKNRLDYLLCSVYMKERQKLMDIIHLTSLQNKSWLYHDGGQFYICNGYVSGCGRVYPPPFLLSSYCGLGILGILQRILGLGDVTSLHEVTNSETVYIYYKA